MLDRIVKFLATGAYVGYSPYMPGTIGTLWGIVIAYFTTGLSMYPQAGITLFVLLISVPVASRASALLGEKDPSSVVCDEIAGALIGFFLLPFDWKTATLVFILFRFFDILKPYPIGLIDRKMKGGAGIVLDDAVAGVFTNIAARLVMAYYAGL